MTIGLFTVAELFVVLVFSVDLLALISFIKNVLELILVVICLPILLLFFEFELLLTIRLLFFVFELLLTHHLLFFAFELLYQLTVVLVDLFLDFLL